jgi:hypothetical protein
LQLARRWRLLIEDMKLSFFVFWELARDAMAQTEAGTQLPLELKLSLRLFLRLFQSLGDDVPSTLALVARVPDLLAGLPALALYSSNAGVCVRCAICNRSASALDIIFACCCIAQSQSVAAALTAATVKLLKLRHQLNAEQFGSVLAARVGLAVKSASLEALLSAALQLIASAAGEATAVEVPIGGLLQDLCVAAAQAPGSVDDAKALQVQLLSFACTSALCLCQVLD